ncbi:MAG: Txe/YoeB family addiction module toxin [Mycoplasmataceae bacterium]|nr:Txe/YoeB family addiction module toxin [Mycoplasmataceae bacterium]
MFFQWCLGKPESLKYHGNNFWSRRTTKEHRLIYAVSNDSIRLLTCHGHYK